MTFGMRLFDILDSRSSLVHFTLTVKVFRPADLKNDNGGGRNGEEKYRQGRLYNYIKKGDDAETASSPLIFSGCTMADICYFLGSSKLGVTSSFLTAFRRMIIPPTKKAMMAMTTMPATHTHHGRIALVVEV